MRLIKTFPLLVFVVSVWSCVTHANDISAELEANILNRIALKQNPGMIIGIVDEEGTRYYGFGETAPGNNTKPSSETVYEIGSVTKTFTGVALAEMSLKGKVALDTPVQTLLPDTVTMPQRNGKQITLAQLSTHHSSLPRMPNNFTPQNALNPYADYSVSDMYDFLSNYQLTHDIDTEGAYSNLGTGLLGHALALANNSSYEAMLDQYLLSPLSMNDTVITLDQRLQSLLAPPYQSLNYTLSPVQNWDIPTLAGAGALRSNAQDMMKYLKANIGLTETPLRAAMDLSHSPQRDFNGPQIGLGWIIRGEGEDTIYWHNGGTGGYRAFAGFSKTNKKGVVVLTNSNVSADDVGFYLLDPSTKLIEYKKRTEITVEPSVLERYIGTYQLSPAFSIEVTVTGDKIYAQATNQSRFQIFPESETRYFYKIINAQISFEFDDDGSVKSLILHQNGRNTPGEKIK